MNVESILKNLSLHVQRDEGTEYALFCPFHRNASTPAFFINKRTGLWNCFNPNCAKKGNIKTLIRELGRGQNVVLTPEIEDILEGIASLEEQKEEHEEDWGEVLEQIQIDYDSPSDVKKLSYLHERGFKWSTLKTFEIAFSESKKRIVIPCRDENWKIVGFIGRAAEEGVHPKYLYSKEFPRKGVLFNLNRARSERFVVVCEGSLDAAKIYQAGFHGAVSTLGANVTDEHIKKLNDFFDQIYIFPDLDEAGEGMTNRILKELSMKDVRIARYPDHYVREHEANGTKFDPGSISEEDIAWGIENAVTGFDHMFASM